MFNVSWNYHGSGDALVQLGTDPHRIGVASWHAYLFSKKSFGHHAILIRSFYAPNGLYRGYVDTYLS
jgi:hypothetical protein